MTSPDEYEYILWKVLTNIDFSHKSTGRLDDLTYVFQQNDPRNFQYQIVFQSLVKQGLILTGKNRKAGIVGDNKHIGITIPYSIKNLQKIDKLYSELSERYKNDLRHSKPILYVNERGIYFSMNPQQKYRAGKKRGQLIGLLRNSTRKRKALLKEIGGKSEKDITDMVIGINKVFAKNIAGSPNAKLINLSSQGYSLNTRDYDIKN